MWGSLLKKLIGISRHQQQSGAFSAWGCVQLWRQAAGPHLRKLLCDPCFKRFCLRFSGCDLDVNEGFMTGMRCGIWFSCWCEYTVEGFLNALIHLLWYICTLLYTQVVFFPREHLEISGAFLVDITGGGEVAAAGISWVEPKDMTKPRTTRRTAPQQTELSGPKCH